jgi:hypothetical protein
VACDISAANASVRSRARSAASPGPGVSVAACNAPSRTRTDRPCARAQLSKDNDDADGDSCSPGGSISARAERSTPRATDGAGDRAAVVSSSCEPRRRAQGPRHGGTPAATLSLRRCCRTADPQAPSAEAAESSLPAGGSTRSRRRGVTWQVQEQARSQPGAVVSAASVSGSAYASAVTRHSRRSAAAQPEFLIDRSPGRLEVTITHRSAGLTVRTLADVYGEEAAQETEDTAWIKLAADRDWIVLCKDDRIRRFSAAAAASCGPARRRLPTGAACTWTPRQSSTGPIQPSRRQRTASQVRRR